MKCNIYSMEFGKVEIDHIKAAVFRGYELFEVEIYDGHIPVIGEINSTFFLISEDGSAREYDITIGYYEFKNDFLTIVAAFK